MQSPNIQPVDGFPQGGLPVLLHRLTGSLLSYSIGDHCAQSWYSVINPRKWFIQKQRPHVEEHAIHIYTLRITDDSSVFFDLFS